MATSSESDLVVSSSSEVGLRDIRDGVPLCVGDGFPANSTAEWRRVKAKGKIVTGKIKPIKKSMVCVTSRFRIRIKAQSNVGVRSTEYGYPC